MKGRLLRLIYLILFLLIPLGSPASVDTTELSLFAEESWLELLDKDGIKVFSQKIPDSDILAFKATGTLKAPIEQIMEVLRKVEISSEWLPDTKIKYTVRELSDLEAITYSVTYLPWPFSDRELLLHNRLRLDRQRKYLVVDTFSVEDSSHPVGTNNVRAYMEIGRTFIRPVDNQHTEILFAFLLDPRGYIPAWVVNLKQKHMPYYFLKNLEEKAGSTRFELRPVFREYLEELNRMMERPVRAEVQ